MAILCPIKVLFKTLDLVNAIQVAQEVELNEKRLQKIFSLNKQLIDLLHKEVTANAQGGV